MANGGKEVIVLDSSDDDAEKIGNYEDKERNKFEISNGSGNGGRHFSTKAEWYAYLRDLGDFPVKARQSEDCSLSRNEKRKRTEKSQGAEDVEGSEVLGADEVLASEDGVGQQQGGCDTGEGSINITSMPGERAESTGKGDHCFFCSEGQEGTADAGYSQVPAALKGATKEEIEACDTGEGYIDITSMLGERAESTGKGDHCFSCSGGQEGTADAGYSQVPAVLRDAIKEEKEGYDTGEGYIDTSMPGERTESTGKGDHCFFCSEGQEGTVDAGYSQVPAALKDATKEEKEIDVMEIGEQGDKNAALETMTLSEAEPVGRKDKVLVMLQPRRYFDFQESSPKPCYKCGEDDHIAAQCTAPKKKKTCFICGVSGHHGDRCKQVNNCYFCGRRGHLAKDCPQEDILREQTSNLCLRCGESGHNMFSCSNDYSSDDLERIQCYVCKAFGHLCCVNERNEGPRSVSCYNCGESGHQGFECLKPHENGNGSQNGGKGSKAKARRKKKSKKAKVVHEAAAATPPQEKNDVSGVKVSAHRLDNGSKSNTWHNNRVNGPKNWAQWRGLNYIPQQRPFFGVLRSNVWLSPMEAAKRNANLNKNLTSSSQSFSQRTQ